MAEIEFSGDERQIRLTVRTKNKAAISDFERRLLERFNILKVQWDQRMTYEFVMELKKGILLKKEQVASVVRIDLRKSGLQ